jgi:gluconolactonase
MPIETGHGTTLSIAHRAHTRAEKRDALVIPEDRCRTIDADRHRAGIDYAMPNVALVTRTPTVIAALGGQVAGVFEAR